MTATEGAGIERLLRRDRAITATLLAVLCALAWVYVATGAVHVPHPKFALDGTHIITPAEAMSLESLPEKLLIVGSDYMAVELAMIFSALGSQTTIMCEEPELLP